MLNKRVTIQNKKGLHARAAAKFVKVTEKHGALIQVARADAPEQSVLATSILGLMMLAAEPGTDLLLTAEDSPQNKTCLSDLEDLITRRFDEDS